MSRPRRAVASFALASALMLAAGACASTGPSAEARRVGATLEIVNRTPVDLGISVRGRLEGYVPAGERARYRHLPGGPAALHAAPRERTPNAAHAAEVALEAGATTRWEIVPADPAEALPEPPALADLTVDNPSVRPVAIAVDGRHLGRVFPGERRTFRDLPAGPRAAVATTDELGLAARAELTLAPGDDNAWTVALSGARLEILNDAEEPVALRVDGVGRGTIAPGERWISDAEAPGIRSVVATGERTRRPWEATLELSPSEPTTWRLASSGAALRVQNATGEAIAVAFTGRELPVLEPGEETLVEGLEPGPVRVSAVGQRTRLVYGFEARLGPGQRAIWRAAPIRPTVRVVNDSGAAALIFVESPAVDPRPGAPTREMRLRTELPPGRAVLLDDLLPTPFRVEAVDPHGTWRREREIDPIATPASTWVLERAAGAVTVANDRPEDLDVFLDAVSLGFVEARTTRTFTGALVGPRLVEARGRRSGAVLRARVEVTEEAPAVARFEDPTATLEIENLLGVPLATTGALAEQRAVVPAGATVAFLVPARAVAVGVVDPDGVPWSWQARPGPGETVRWRIAPATTSLVVQNDLDEELAVTVDDQSVGTVGPGHRATWSGVATGRRRFASVGMKSGRVRTLTEVATAARPVSWTLATRPGRVVVDNCTAEAVEVYIDGHQHRAVEAGASLAFEQIAPGARRIDVVGARSRARQVFEATVEEGMDALIHVAAPRGALLVENLSGQDVIVRVDGVRVGRVPRDAPITALAAPAGQRLVQIERADDHTVTGMEVAVGPGHAVHVLVPRPAVRLVVVNQTDGALAVRAGDRALGEVAAGASAVFEDVAPGLTDLSARAGEAPPSHVERRALRPGETATWVLQR